MDKGKLEGKVAIVTGATSGIGEAIAYIFAREEAKVILAARREAKGKQNERKIADEGGEAIFVKMDVTKKEEVKELVETTMSTYGRIDILVNNAGILQDKRFEDLTVKDWYEVMSVDGLGYLLTMWEVLPIMKKQGSGCVINVSSISATRPWETQPFYCFVKAGINHLTRCLNNEYAGYGIRINSLAPGLVLTEMTKDGPLKELSKGIPMKRYATSDEIAGSALFLASKDASYISGAVINIDGGLVS